jgi:hypothetical protein
MIELDGTIDSHVHAGPELFVRSGDAVELARAARDAGMAGLLLKCHHESTATRAYFAEKAVPGIKIYGGIAMNGFVGGINPLAVGSALEQGAKMIWGPTMHADHHVCHVGAGTYGVKNLKLKPHLAMKPGIKATDDNGALLPQMREVIALAKMYNAAIATAHFGDTCVRAIVEECAEQGVRVVLTHVFFLDQQEKFIVDMLNMGAIAEVSAAAANPLESWMFRTHGGGMKLEQVRKLYELVGRDRIVLSSDLGQDYNTPPVHGFKAFLNQVSAVGIGDEDTKYMATTVPRRILALD